MAILTTTNQGLNFIGGTTFIQTGTSTVMSLQTSGNVGIGTPNPAAKLDVVGNIKSPTNSLSTTAAPTSFGVYTSEVRLIDTPNGGLKKCRVITDVYGEWILVGRFAASAMNTIANAATWGSVSGMTTGTAQNETTQFSADFGDSFPSEVRIMGATDFTSWRDTRTVDFVYKVPEGRKWKFFFSGGVENGMVQSTKFGWNINGAYDGFGRWVNTAQNFVRMSDGQVNNPSAAYTTATANAFAWDTADDAKITVSATRVFSGQDTFETAGFGNDDNIYGFFDEYPNETSNMQGGVDFSSAAWVLIKLPEGASGSGGSGTNYWAANGNDISNTNSGNVGIGTTSPEILLTLSKTTNNTSLGFFNTGTNAANRNWTVGSNDQLFGDFVIKTSNAIGGNPISAGVARLYISPTGNVGIGTDSPLGKLQVTLPAYDNEDTNSQQAIFGVDNGGGLRIGYNETSNKGYINVLKPAVAWGSLVLQSGGGNVGIGTTTPTGDLSVGSTTTSSGDIHLRTSKTTVTLTPSNVAGGGFNIDTGFVSGGQGPMTLSIGGAERMRITSAGNLQLKGTTPTLDFFKTSAGDVLANIKVESGAGTGGKFTIQTKRNGNTALDALVINESQTVGIGSTGIYAGTNASLNLPGIGLAIKNDLNGSSNNWSYITNTDTASSANLNFHTGNNASALTLSHSGDATFGSSVTINGEGDTLTLSKSNNLPVLRFKGAGTDAALIEGGNFLNFYVGGTSKFKIESSGAVNIGYIGTLGGFGTEDVSGIFYSGGNTGGYTAINSNSNNAPLYLARGASTPTGILINMASNGTGVGSISITGSATAYNTSSDYRLKEDLQDFAGLDMVSKIPVYDFKWKTDESRTYGVMAHELQEVLPNAVTGQKDADEMQSVDYSKIVPLLIKSIQELTAKIERLEAK